jgi:hypothetical protein
LLRVASGNDFVLLVVEKERRGAAFLGQGQQIEAEGVVLVGGIGILEEGEGRTHQQLGNPHESFGVQLTD